MGSNHMEQKEEELFQESDPVEDNIMQMPENGGGPFEDINTNPMGDGTHE